MPLRLVHAPGSPAPHGWSADFLAHLSKQFGLLNMPCPTHVVALDDARTPPELLLYFGSTPWDDGSDEPLTTALTAYANEAAHLLPIIEEDGHAVTHMPAALQRFNAFVRGRFATTYTEALVDEVLTLLWQRRRQRRIFISYRRRESVDMARQLHEHFTAMSFNVFLDERSIEPGVDVQRKLRHELDDSDAVLLLVSPALYASRWVREEVQFAQTRRIGLLGILWPTGPGADPTVAVAAAAQLSPDQRVVLAAPTGHAAAGRTLTPIELAEVDRLVFVGRSQAISRRISELVDAAEHALPEFTIGARRSDGDLELVRDGSRWLGRVAPFRPSPFDLWRWWDEERRADPDLEGLVVLYPQVDSQDIGERAFRAVCDAWGETSFPRVWLRPVHV